MRKQHLNACIKFRCRVLQLLDSTPKELVQYLRIQYRSYDALQVGRITAGVRSAF